MNNALRCAALTSGEVVDKAVKLWEAGVVNEDGHHASVPSSGVTL